MALLQEVSMYMLEQGQAGRELNAIAYQPLRAILAKYVRDNYDKSLGEAAAIAVDVLAHLRERTFILAEIGEGIFGFVHRTFMEYFAACNCRAEFNRRKADYDWLKQEVFGKYWQKDEWQEVLFLLVAMLAAQKSPVQEVVDYLRQQQFKGEMPFNLVFAARCLGESGAIEDESWAQDLLNKLFEAIVKYSKPKSSTKFLQSGLAALSILASIIDISKELKNRINRLKNSNHPQKSLTGRQILLAIKPRQKRLTSALADLHNEKEAIVCAAINALERDSAGNVEVGCALVNLVETQRHVSIKKAAIEALLRSWSATQCPQTLPLLQDRAVNDNDSGVRRFAVNALAEHFRNDPQTLLLLQNWAGKPGYSDIRSAAIKALAEHFRDDPQTLPLLRDRAVNDADSGVRCAAVKAIIEHFRDDPQTLPLLRDRAVNDDDSGVRRVAVEALAEHFGDDSQTLPLLRDRAVNDGYASVRRTAKNLISRYFGE